jgi:hypothetical protein
MARSSLRRLSLSKNFPGRVWAISNLQLTQLTGGFAMQPKTEGLEEHGPSGVRFINDPEKPTSPPLNDADAADAVEAEEDFEDDGQSL